MVWGMYTGPYLALLKSKNYVKTQKGIIIESVFHALSETRAKAFVNGRIFGDSNNNYLTPKGLNQDLGFAAYVDVMSPNGDRFKENNLIDKLPNIMNYQNFLENLFQNSRCSSLTLSENPTFIWGVNLIPNTKTINSLYKMIEIKDNYKKAKKSLVFSSASKENNIGKTTELKKEFSLLMQKQAETVNNELANMLKFVFSSQI
ncbi:MAG: hypothetical protein ACD_12C00090G0002 [uncultured bacterium]|nr:MAG: hypothetical protein ACD_12C00090G0002 [uncultured bacterium]